jgi:hypothetical protein
MEKNLVKRPGPIHSQCRGRGFESLHLHQKAQVNGLKVGSPKVTYFAGNEASFRSGCANIAGWNRAMDIL